MTEKPQAADPETTGSTPGGSGPAQEQTGERVVIRDRRKIDRSDDGTDPTIDDVDSANAEASVNGVEPGQPDESDDDELVGESDRPGTPILDELVEDAEVEVELADGKARGPKLDQPAGLEGAVVDAPAKPVGGAPGPLGAELEALRAELDERTRDLQRVSAEYANYRKRVDRDRGLAAEQTTGQVLTALLPVLDDLDRAREHGDLVGPFGTVAEQLNTALTRFGLTPFGEKGDPFDPTRHEAVAHRTSAEVTEPTCVEVMRRGYQLGERLLRPALVAVADPE
ncbi:nucleotide exchange factor GrpE [Micromonospora sp. NBC_01699]|uniref:nucleotide exchange factor GrpE n=1 Tax=Micromonospora sp. NBC_01699 TaxID=2975984 RepID=UPI002E29A3FB|nr:nucleotide exchange factor GrpE [Micromonospora sp. NBC_01699]